MNKYQGVWRRKGTRSKGFPKLMVDDNVQSGSINVRNTRLPLWAIITTAITEGWEQVERGWESENHYNYSRHDLAHFLYCLLEQRGEFGRLLMLLAKVERLECWWENTNARRRVIKQLQNCMDALNELESEL